jgi:hypothetical protein
MDALTLPEQRKLRDLLVKIQAAANAEEAAG